MGESNMDHAAEQPRSRATARPDDLTFYRWQPALGLTGSVNMQRPGSTERHSSFELVRWITLTPDPGDPVGPAS